VKLPRLLAVLFLTLGTSFFFIPLANAVPPELMVRNVTIICANAAGETYTANTGWDADNSYFNGRGDIARLFCEGGFIGEWTTYVSDNYTGPGRYYNGVAPTPAPTPSPTPSPSVEPTPEPSPTQPVPSPTPSGDPSPTPTPEPSPVPSPTPSPEIPTPEPSPIPPVSIPEPQPVILPQPELQPQPLPTPIPDPEPIIPPQPEPEPPVPVEEPPAPAEEPPVPVEEPPAIEEEPPVVEPLPPTPELEVILLEEDTDLSELDPETPIQLENGVILTAETVIAIQLLEDPVALIQELFTDPAAAFAALGSVGADMTDEVREESEKVIIAAVIAGNIATTASTAAAGAASYRRKL